MEWGGDLKSCQPARIREAQCREDVTSPASVLPAQSWGTTCPAGIAKVTQEGGPPCFHHLLRPSSSLLATLPLLSACCFSSCAHWLCGLLKEAGW